jgi:mannonate dehydratase
MRIVDAKVITRCPGSHFVTLKIMTEDGIYETGDATLNGFDPSVADHVVPIRVDRDAQDRYLYKGVYWRRGPVKMSGIAAVDNDLLLEQS